MAKLLGSKYCIESLRGDVTDLNAVVVDILSRVGPSATFRSWKYPDKVSSDLDIADLVKRYDYSDDEEENQVAHIVLMELIIDRFVLLLQAVGKYVDSLSTKVNAIPSSQTSGGSSIGPLVKKYWKRMIQLCSVLKQLQSENKAKTRKISEFEDTALLYSRRSSSDQSDSPPKPLVPDSGLMTPSVMDRGAVSRPASAALVPVPPPGRDEYNKATQTVETSFVPCASCDAVQCSLRAVGDAMSHMCQSLDLTSSLDKYRSRVSGLTWLSAGDIDRWTAEQNKDISNILAHVQQLASTVEPLKTELEAERKKMKDLTSKMSATKQEAARERETSASMRRQYENKLKELEKSKIAIITELDHQKSELSESKSELESRVSQLTMELSISKNQVRQLEKSKIDLLQQMEERLANNERVSELQTDLDQLNNELSTVSERLKEAAIELNKEKARNKSASQHNESVQSKQESLLQRLDELDSENNDLRLQIADLEDVKEQLQTEIAKITKERDKLVAKAVKEKNNNQANEQAPASNGGKNMEADVKTLQNNIARLESLLAEAKENERLLVEYPDLHYTGNTANLTGTGNVAKDMENQIKANSLRINVLESENAKLRATVGKMLNAAASGGNGSTKSFNSAGDEGGDRWATAVPPPLAQHPPVQLWKLDVQDRNGPRSTHASDTPSAEKFRPSVQSGYLDSDVDISRGVQNSNALPRTTRKTSSGNARAGRSRNHDSAMTQNTAAAGGSSRGAEWSQLTSGGRQFDVFTCPHCDKIYQSKRELTIHQSYCYGGI